MNIELKYGLPFVEVMICYRESELHLKNVLLDTGSAGTVFSADADDCALFGPSIASFDLLQLPPPIIDKPMPVIEKCASRRQTNLTKINVIKNLRSNYMYGIMKRRCL
jgi:hypothetical protein